MMAFGIWHWVIVLTVIFLVAIPTARILQRTGLSPWWTILALIPWVNLAALWAFAFVRWPIEDRPAD